MSACDNVLLSLSSANSTSANSPFSFLWLQGYQACRTGWDRFSKPDKRSSGNHLIDFGDSGSSEEGSGLPGNHGNTYTTCCDGFCCLQRNGRGLTSSHQILMERQQVPVSNSPAHPPTHPIHSPTHSTTSALHEDSVLLLHIIP